MRVYNTLSKREEELKLDRTVRIYVCGITAYDYCHIGHARTFVFFDTLRRYLEFKGHRVIMIQNFTDVDDKIVKRAVNEGKTQKDIAERFIEEYFRDIKPLNVKDADYYPRVTDHIGDIIDAIRRLIDSGYAYEVEDETGKDVYFHVPSFESYGRLSGMSLDDLDRHRIEPNPKKKDVKDFALWKSAKEDDIKAKAFFDSPWGIGRPGWHIECTVMSAKYLGIPFDIHGGGKDLIFPHHENERAQSYALFGVEPVRYWIHNDFITIRGEKMSKSLGNIVRIRDVLRRYDGEVLRYFLLSAHYRSPLDYSEDALRNSNKAYNYLKNSLENLDMEIAAVKTFRIERERKGIEIYVREFVNSFINAMDSDFNTPKAISALHSFSGFINKNVYNLNLDELEYCFQWFTKLCNVLGLFENYRRIPVLPDDLVNLIKEREIARKERNFEKADKIRERLREKGIMLIDTPVGTRWRVIG